MSEEIVLSDYLEELRREIQSLREQLSVLLQEKEDLIYHVCPKLESRYASVIGVYENRAHYLELQILELKRRIEMMQAAINRAKTISMEQMEDQIRKEYQAFHDKVEEERKKAEQDQKSQREKEAKEQEFRKAWEEKYGKSKSGVPSEDADQGRQKEQDASDKSGDPFGDKADGEESGDSRKAGEDKTPNLKDLYRKIVKRLHPDVNPNATEREKELFRKATKAYQEGDLVTLQEIYDEIFTGASEEMEADDLTPERLQEIVRKLKEQICAVQEEIRKIKNRVPYLYKKLLDDPEKIRLVQEKIMEAIALYESEINRLQGIMEDVQSQMASGSI